MRAGAVVDVKDKDGWTPLKFCIKVNAEESAEFLLDAGAKVANLKADKERPDWFEAMLNRRMHCREACGVLYGVLRKRWHMGDGARVPRDLITLLTGLLWASRRDERWLREHDEDSPS